MAVDSPDEEPTRPEGIYQPSIGWTERADMVSQQRSAMNFLEVSHDRRVEATNALDDRPALDPELQADVAQEPTQEANLEALEQDPQLEWAIAAIDEAGLEQADLSPTLDVSNERPMDYYAELDKETEPVVETPGDASLTAQTLSNDDLAWALTAAEVAAREDPALEQQSPQIEY